MRVDSSKPRRRTMSSATTLSAILQNPRVNRSTNDVTWFSGWDQKVHTYQYGLDVREAHKVVAKIKAIKGKADQKAVLGELYSRTFTRDAFVSTNVRLTQAAAKTFTAFARTLGMSNTFSYGQAKA